MIGRLSGLIAQKSGEDLIIDTASGVGYCVSCPDRVAGVSCVGDHVTLWIETIVREDAIRLYGFLSLEEKACFCELLKVQGVGARHALAILSCLEVHEIEHACRMELKSAFQQVSGVGPRLAERIIREMKILENHCVVSHLLVYKADAMSAVMQLGCPRDRAEALYTEVMKDRGSPSSLEEIVEHMLKRM